MVVASADGGKGWAQFPFIADWSLWLYVASVVYVITFGAVVSLAAPRESRAERRRRKECLREEMLEAVEGPLTAARPLSDLGWKEECRDPERPMEFSYPDEWGPWEDGKDGEVDGMFLYI